MKALTPNRLEARLAAMGERDRKGLAPFLCAGDGGLECTRATLEALEEAGADCIELGVPFSDPIADGPVLQAASQRALAAGTRFAGILEMIHDFRAAGGEVPVALMSYVNPLLRRGWERSCGQAAAAGVDALILPDLPWEESAPMCAAAAENDLCPIFFAAPTSPSDRVRRAARAGRGFLYALGRVGVTGAETRFDEAVQGYLERVAAAARPLPLAVGFGIASAAAVRAATRHARLAIVGSALVRELHEVGPAAAPGRAASFLRELRGGLE